MRSKLSLAFLFVLILPTFSASQAEASHSVTFAARVCSSYEDVTANRARNNIQESLRDLGPDTPYGEGETVQARVEDGVQPNCRPLPDWKFTLGRAVADDPSVGPWGSLSTVARPFADQIVTQPSVPLLNDQGERTGEQIQGAVTYELTKEQRDLAARSSRLWVQGGIPSDPVLFDEKGEAYGFAALRCLTDDLNGDNVEWISFASGSTHGFCFAYYIQPPPTAGTIVVRKEASGQPEGADPVTFPFEGNVSYITGGRFDLTAGDGSPDSIEFVRGAVGPGDPTWDFTEDTPPNWVIDDVTCNSSEGTSSFTTQAAGASITLAAGDRVTCTVSNRYQPPPGGLVIQKVTQGSTGTFRFGIDGPESRNVRLTTEKQDVPVSTPNLDVPPGEYTIDENLPRSRRGKWSLESVECNGRNRRLTSAGTQTVRVRSGQVMVCTFTNDFDPFGALRVRMITVGGTAATGYNVNGEGPSGNPFEANLVAKTTRPLQPARATGARLKPIPLQNYAIQQNEIGEKGWTLVAVICNREITPFVQGTVQVKLTRSRPRVSCDFINRRERDPDPPRPKPPAPEPGPFGDRARLVIKKRALNPVVQLGQRVAYRVRITNRGPGTAYGTFVDERQLSSLSGERLLSIRTSKGRCILLQVRPRDRVPVCRLGDLAPGESVTITAVTRPLHTGVFNNRVVASTASTTTGPKPVARARSRVFRIPKPPRNPDPCIPRTRSNATRC